MFRNLLKNKKAQNTAEYALLIALVVAGIIAMQQYAQRALQARVRDASVYMATTSNVIGNSVQYEPYYQKTNYEITRDSTENKQLDLNVTAQQADSERARMGDSSTLYNATTNTTVTTGIMPSGV